MSVSITCEWGFLSCFPGERENSKNWVLTGNWLLSKLLALQSLSFFLEERTALAYFCCYIVLLVFLSVCFFLFKREGCLSFKKAHRSSALKMNFEMKCSVMFE